MPANPKLLTLGDTVWAVDARPGDLLVLNDEVIPMWDVVGIADHLDPESATVADLVRALIQCGLMRAE